MGSQDQCEKIVWSGKVVSIQPRIRLTRSFDQRTHNYLGYIVTIQGSAGGEERSFSVGIGKAAQEKHQIRAGDLVSGKAEAVQDSRSEVAEYYKASDLKVVARTMEAQTSAPPWQGVTPPLEVYRQRGH